MILKYYNMKKQHFYGLLWVTLFLYSCGSATKDELAGKKAELDKLKQEQQGISDKITALELEISKLDTAAAKSSGDGSMCGSRLSGSATVSISKNCALPMRMAFQVLRGGVPPMP